MLRQNPQPDPRIGYTTGFVTPSRLTASRIPGSTSAIARMSNSSRRCHSAFPFQIFPAPIGAFQSIGHYLADGITAIDGGRVLVHQAAWARDTGGGDVERLAPMAKLFATQTCRDVSSTTIQIHGGMGFTVECDAQLYFRRAKSWQLNWFDDDQLEELIATRVLD